MSLIKIVACLALVAVVKAGVLPEQYHEVLQHDHHAHAAHQAHHLEHEHEHDHYDANPKYTFSYDVNDHLTYDAKSQSESRDGDHVQGEYSVHDPDGFLRTVKYTVDPHSGFQAIVERQPLQHKIPASPAYAALPAHHDHHDHHEHYHH